jgi:hypothetical protein
LVPALGTGVDRCTDGLLNADLSRRRGASGEPIEEEFDEEHHTNWWLDQSAG